MSNAMNYILDNLNKSSKKKGGHVGGGAGGLNPFSNIMGMAGQTNQKIRTLIGGMGNMTSGYGKYVSMYMSIPCMVYQNIANAVCRLSGTGMFSPQNMMPPRSAQPPTQGGNDNDTDLDENILNDIDEDNLDDDEETSTNTKITNLKIKQSGGGYRLKRNALPKYSYIINPLTSRKVKLNSKKGKMILSVYLNNYGA